MKTMDRRIRDRILQDKIPQYEIYPDISPQCNIPLYIISQSETRDKIPQLKIKLHINKRTPFYHNNWLHSSRAR